MLSTTIKLLTPGAVLDASAEQVSTLVADTSQAFVWIDVPEWTDQTERVLAPLNLHPLALASCRERNHVPTVHGYPDHVFLVLHSAEARSDGHVHLLELDLFVGPRFLVTVHGPLNPEVPAELAVRETEAVLTRLESGRFRPASPAALAYAVVTAVVRRLRDEVSTVARKIAGLERRVMTSDLRRPEALMEEMFVIRHELLTVRTMAAQAAQVCGRAAALARVLDPADQPLFSDLAEQYNRLSAVTDGEKDFVFGVIELYHTRVSTKMTVAMERLAVLAAVTLPITAIASVVGMNVIVSRSTRPVALVAVLLVMAVISGWLLRWTKRQGWW